MIIDLISLLLLVGSGAFFAAGTLGMLRFPDSFSRLHALTKADNLGLGLLGGALGLQAESAAVVAKLVLIWLVAMLVGSASSYLVARHGFMRDRPNGKGAER